jgi:signal peptidase II
MNTSMAQPQPTIPECGPPSDDHNTCVTHRPKTLYVLLIMALTDVLVFDAVVKWLVTQQPIGKMVSIVPGVFDFYHVENTGVAFGLLNGTVTPIITSAILLSVLVYYTVKLPLVAKRQAVGLGLLLGGGLNNWLDRVLTGAVTDYIYLPFIDFPVFNASDVAIFMGSIMVGTFMLLRYRAEGTHSS